ncbi:hypothetical protein M378DRAFT_85776, partial [Amanita muscaria Koide BX008]
AAGVIDNPRSPLSYAERLEALEKREDAWRTLEPVFETTIEVNHHPFGNHGLTAGTYFLDDKDRKDLYFCHLPSSPQDNPRWVRIPGHGPAQNWSGLLISFALAVYEHDLIINVVSSEIGNQTDMQRHSLDLVLLKFSTGEYHPLARHPRIHVQRSSDVRPSVIPTVLGDNVALVVHSGENAAASLHKLFIFDWKTGHKRLQHGAAKNAYSTPVFVSPELLLVPNRALSSFEVWHLPPSHANTTPPVQILSLRLPAVSQNFFIFDLACDGGPSPFLHSIPYFLPRPFFPSPENSIIIANLRVETFKGLRSASYTLIMSRRALLDTIQQWYNFPQVQWADWGPPISRWFRVAERRTMLTPTSAGQRCALLLPDPDDMEKSIVSVADFNPHNFRRNARVTRGEEGDDHSDNGNNQEGEEEEEDEEEDEAELEILEHGGRFSGEVYMGLKCVVHNAPDEYDFDAVLMDEERLLGVTVSIRKMIIFSPDKC